MTREEAYNILYNGLLQSSEHEWCVAFKMAITALKGEPCEDCISRTYMKDCINEEANYTGHAILSLLETLPSVEQEPKYGKWIHIGGGEWICSECGKFIITEGSWDKPTDKYCKGCGVKMSEILTGSGSER